MHAPLTSNRRSVLLGATTLAAASALGSGLPIGMELSPANAQTAPAGGSPYSFERGFPMRDTARRIQDEQDEQRALQAYRLLLSDRLDGGHVPRPAGWRH